MNRSDLKNRYFEHGRRCLDAIWNPPPGGYLCPICLNLFRTIAGLTLEHVPPRMQGGKKLCLTCKECNSTAGHTIDAAVHRSWKFDRFLEPGAGFQRAKLQIDEIRLNVDVSLDNRAISIVVPPGVNDPQNIESGNLAMRRAVEEGREFTLIRSEKVQRRDADIAYLKSAYMAAFAKFGYRLILRPTLEIVRKQIREPRVMHIGRFRIYLKQELMYERGLYISGKPIIALLVTDGKSVVLLPWVASKEDVYEWLATNESRQTTLHFTLSQACPWPDSLELALDSFAPDAPR